MNRTKLALIHDQNSRDIKIKVYELKLALPSHDLNGLRLKKVNEQGQVTIKFF